MARDVLAATGAEAAAKRYEANIEKYQKENEQIMEKAREFEKESAAKGRQALRLEMGEVFLEVAIVLCSLAILARRRMFWGLGLASSIAGAAIAVTMFFVH